MRLVSLRLVDFLNHCDTSIEFGPVTVIAGPNNAGKSAIKDAIEMLLTGTARTTDKAGRDSASLVRSGAKRFTVQGELVTREDGKARTLTVTRSKGLGGGHELSVEEEGMGGWSGSIADVEKALHRALNASPGLIRACIHAGRLPEMAPNEQEALLFATLGLNFTAERIEELLIDCGCAEADVKLLHSGARGTFVGGLVKMEYGPEIFDHAYKFAYGSRAQAKKDAGSVAAELAETEKQVLRLERETPLVAKTDREWLARNTATLDELEKERDAMLVEVGKVGDLDEEIAAAESEIAENKKLLKERRAWEKRVETAGGRSCVLDHIKTIETITLPSSHSHHARASADVVNTKAAIEGFGDDEAICPVAGIACPVKPADRAQIMDELKERFIAFVHKERETKCDVQQEEKALTALRAVADAEPDSDGLANLERQAAILAEQLKRLTKLKGSERGAELETLTDRIARGRAKLQLVKSYLAAKEGIEAIREGAKAAEGHVEQWERLVTALSPGGAKLRAVDGPLKDLQTRINERIAQYTQGYEVAVRTEDGFELVVRTPGTDGGWVPTRSLSTSERLRVGVALQDALSHLSGLGFLLVDNFDMLDALNKAAVGEALHAWSEHYDSIVVLMTRDSRPSASEKRATYWIEAGQAEVVA